MAKNGLLQFPDFTLPLSYSFFALIQKSKFQTWGI